MDTSGQEYQRQLVLKLQEQLNYIGDQSSVDFDFENLFAEISAAIVAIVAQYATENPTLVLGDPGVATGLSTYINENLEVSYDIVTGGPMPPVRVALASTYEKVLDFGTTDQPGKVFELDSYPEAAPEPDWLTVTATSPTDGAIDVAVDTAITITFSNALQPLTVLPEHFSLDDGTTVTYPTAVALTEGSTVVTLTLSDVLETGKTYKIGVSANVRSSFDTPLEIDFEQATGFATVV